jgi:hypothetical protein
MEDKISEVVLKRLNITKPELTEKSMNVYVNNLFRLNNNQIITNLRFLFDKDSIMEKIKDKKTSTQRNYLFAIVTFIQPMIGNSHYKKLFEDYSTELKKAINDSDSERKTKKLEKPNSSINEKAEELVSEVLSMSDEDRKKNWKKVRDACLLSVFTMIEPRRSLDYSDMFIDSEDNSVNNFDRKKKMFVFNKYKTSKLYGSQQVKLPENLLKILNIWMSVYPLEEGETLTNRPLFITNQKNKINNINGITILLNKLLGKRISVSAIRHSRITEVEGKLLQEAEKKAKERGHSLSTATTYIQHIN